MSVGWACRVPGRSRGRWIDTTTFAFLGNLFVFASRGSIAGFTEKLQNILLSALLNTWFCGQRRQGGGSLGSSPPGSRPASSPPTPSGNPSPRIPPWARSCLLAGIEPVDPIDGFGGRVLVHVRSTRGILTSAPRLNWADVLALHGLAGYLRALDFYWHQIYWHRPDGQLSVIRILVAYRASRRDEIIRRWRSSARVGGCATSTPPRTTTRTGRLGMVSSAWDPVAAATDKR
jgi:hypothetical protein